MARKLERELKRRCQGFPLHNQVARLDPVICAKLYWPIGAVAWYIAGYDSGSYVAYGFATGLGKDGWGYFSVLSVIDTKIAGVPPTLDMGFTATRASVLEILRQELAR